MKNLQAVQIEQLLENWRRSDPHFAEDEKFQAFVRAFLVSNGRGIFRTHEPSAIRRAAQAAFELIQHRAPRERVIRLRNPDDLPGRSVLEILQNDRPFLVDTLRLLLRRHRLREQCMLHPTLDLERKADGALERLIAPDAPVEKGVTRESLVYLELFPRLDAETARALEADLEHVMALVEHVTDDHMRMVRAVRDIASNVEFAGRLTDADNARADKICRFLDWLVDDHFVLMGVRRYTISTLDGVPAVRIAPDSGLGLWHDRHASRFDEAVAGDDLPPALRESIDDTRIIQISKGWVESRVHRAGRLDRILVKEHDDDGQVAGFWIVSGLFTFAALRTPSSQLPLLAERLQQILAAETAPKGSHRHKAIVAAFDSAPMEFLLGASVEDNATLISEIVEAEGAGESRVVVRTSAGGRAFYVAVILPRELYAEPLRGAIRRLFEREPSVGYVDDRVSFLEEGIALLHFFCTSHTSSVPEAQRLEREITRLAASWDDRLMEELMASQGPAVAGELTARYAEAFPEGLRATTDAADAVRDIVALEALNDRGAPQIALWMERFRSNSSNQMLRLYLQEKRLLSDLLPLIDRLGIRVVDARQVQVNALDRPLAYLHVLRVEPLGADQADLDALVGRLGDALRAVLGDVMPSDMLNGLVLSAGLDWRQVDLLRSYVEYHSQIQAGLTRRFVSEMLLQNPQAARLLVLFHAARLAQSGDDTARDAEAQTLREAFAGYRDRVDNLNEDRALGALFELVDATLRTNFYADLGGEHRIATKLDPSRVAEVSPPYAYREIFVHGPGLGGIHLRGGPVARGGLRWSDRLDDFRTEVLGLMRTQQLKNGLIVPVGAKGGFVLRKMGLDPREARAEADAKYAVFIAGLLDVTDNIDAQGNVVHPAGVRCRDGDDPYLVVAADKGTAHLSDTANAIAMARDFWLGDAFASGGSVGYDHKKYAITARGAWECVKHHFWELGLDPEADSYSVVGIGDMSGDVFGNGLLLMRTAKLVAAFDHRHIMVDPNPDPERSWHERKRLFDLPGSSWADYDTSVLSEGAGVYPRSAKKITLS